MRNTRARRSLASIDTPFRLILLIALAMTIPSQAEAATLVGLGGKCVDVEAAGTANGTPVILYECNGEANQSWDFEAIEPFFRVRGLANKCLRPSAGAGSQLEIGPCDGMEDRWQPSANFPNDFTLVHVSTGECMDVEAASTASGTPINLFPCHGNENQRWNLEQEPVVDPEPGSLVGLAGKCADVERAVSADGTPVNLYTCNGDENQSWEFVSVPPFYQVRGLDGKCLVPGDPGTMGDPAAVIGPCGGLESRWQ